MLAANHIVLGPMHLMAGQNGTGKTTFFHAIRFLSALQRDTGVTAAVEELAPSFFDLCFERERPIAFAVGLHVRRPDEGPAALRYELEIGVDPRGRGRVQVLRENLYLLPAPEPAERPRRAGALLPPILHDEPPRGWLRLLHKTSAGEDRYRDENTGDVTPFRLGPGRTTLSGVIEDASRFPLAMAVRDFLRDGARYIVLNPASLRGTARPGAGTDLASDGGNLPAAVRELRLRDDVQFRHWVSHVGLAVTGLVDVDVYERPEDKHLVLQARFEGRHDAPVPSWTLSDGTLRVMALSLLTFAALPGVPALYLIEEVENGLHPLAMQALYEALTSPPDGVQILCSTHSPVMLGHAQLDHLLLFRRGDDGTARICHGSEDEELVAWTARAALADLFVRGVLS